MSTLVSCPACGRSVPEWFVNDHLDHECAGMQADSGGRGPSDSADNGSGSSNPVAPTKRPIALPSPAKARKKSGSLLSLSKKAPSSSSLDGAAGTAAPGAAHFPSAVSAGSAVQGDSEAEKRLRNTRLPLAERLRPLSLDHFVGQQKLVGPQGILRMLIEGDRVPSMVLWGGPGLGKTTLARIIARCTNSAFREMSAVTQNIADVKKVVEEARNLDRLSGRRTILFLDEIHRFNKAQQDIFLPYLERGQIILIGATTENPSFRLNGALLSRCRVFQLEPLPDEDIAAIAVRACKLKQEDSGLDASGLDGGVAQYIASVSNGDARTAINVVDLAMDALAGKGALDLDCVRSALQRTHVVYGAEEHYDLISALHKSVRGSDANAALYWLGRMLQGGDDPVYIARRMVRMASEDIGLADNGALPLAMAALNACQAIGMPECDTILAHCAVYLARAPKSIESYAAFKRVKAVVASEHPWPVPLHLRNAPTRLMKDLGYAKDYKYNPDFDEPVDQLYLPEQIQNYDFFSSQS
ncbi:DNA-dependent ATPase mgs1 [Coemansia nantahalensis]|uniref:DNA-dependent ATPase mgs1 n=1 Tax=Coemansia nantahalensis TaxID=2789366 RepID=A0ACC1K9E0_9FUNG|nr:DNA-dependent ATPase mgs1 [Coemansia nantahalensis]